MYNTPNPVSSEVEHHDPHLMTLFTRKASKTGKITDAFADIFKVHDEQVIIILQV